MRALLTLLPICLAATLSAQTPTSPPAQPATYDAVTIKPNTTGSGSSGISINDTTYQATNVSLKTLLETAYDIRPDLISGVPAALDSLHFDVNAKVVDPDLKALESIPDAQRRSMILAVLTDRLALKAHVDLRTLPLFELTVLPAGIKFRKSLLPADAPGQGTNVRNRSLDAQAITMTNFASTLTNQIHKTVIDKTGLAGNFDITLKWSPDDADPATANEPDIYTALQEQLGLKLRPAKGPVPTLVVDHIELPSAN